MKLRHALALMAAFVIALALHAVRVWEQRVDAGAAERYGRGLRAVLALELALSAEVMRAKSGLVGHFDALVEVEQRLRAELRALREPPRFLEHGARVELSREIGAAQRERETSEQRLERFKSEHAVLRNSLRFLPVAAHALDAYQPTTPDGQRIKDELSTLVRDVLLLQAVNEQSVIEQVGRQLGTLDRAGAEATLAPELALIVAHARVAHARAPRIAQLLRELMQRPELRRSEERVARYEGFLTDARVRAGRNGDISVALLLLVVLSAALAINLRLSEGAQALRKTTAKLELAVESLGLEKEKQRELAELKSRFVSMTSHEIRTPLSTIMSSSELLEAYAERWPKEKQEEHFARIRSAIRAMLQMLDGVLMVGRSDAGKLEFNPVPISLRPFCEEAIHSAAQTCRFDHEIVLEASEPDEAVVADEQLLRHVVDNLLSNAIKYSPRGTRVSLRVHREGHEVLIEVSDQGIGIPSGDQERLFDIFERGSNVGAVPGTGLGLAIAKRALDLHGGSLSVASQRGAGTRITVRLPDTQRAA